jgi:Uma2 family endonuclease
MTGMASSEHPPRLAQPAKTLSTSELVDLWKRLATDPDTPDHFELTEHGELVVSPPPTNRHQVIVAWAQEQLRDQLDGRAVADLAVRTTGIGVRKPDATWLPSQRWLEALSDEPLAAPPPLVLEVLSPRHIGTAVMHKVEGYLASGVQEVVVIDLKGSVRHHNTDGVHDRSTLGLNLVPPPEMF